MMMMVKSEDEDEDEEINGYVDSWLRRVTVL